MIFGADIDLTSGWATIAAAIPAQVKVLLGVVAAGLTAAAIVMFFKSKRGRGGGMGGGGGQGGSKLVWELAFAAILSGFVVVLPVLLKVAEIVVNGVWLLVKGVGG